MKCDVFGLGGLFTAVGGVASTAMTNDANAIENQRNRKFQADEAEKSRQWDEKMYNRQLSENRKDWDYQFGRQSEEWYNQLYAQYGAQFENWKKQTDYENAYNTPVNQVARLNEAGLNASAVLQNGQVGGLVSASKAAPSASPAPPAGGTSGASVPNGAAAGTPSSIPMENPAGLMSSLGSFIKDITDAGATNKTLQPMIDEIYSRIEKNLAEKDVQKMVQNAMKLSYYVDDQTKDAKIKKEWQEYDNMRLDGYLKRLEGKEVNSRIVLNKLEENLKRLDGKIKDEQLGLIKFEALHQYDTWQAYIRSLNAKSNADNASAGKSVAETKTINKLRDGQYTAQELENKLKQGELDLAPIRQSLLENEELRSTFQLSRDRIEKMRNDELQKWILSTDVGRFFDALVNYTPGVLARIFK